MTDATPPARIRAGSEWASLRPDGTRVGWWLTSGDLTQVTLIARWYSLTTGHLVRSTRPVEEWDRRQSTLPDTDWARLQKTNADRVARRLRRLATAHPYPLLGRQTTNGGWVGWYATPTGARVAGVPWVVRGEPNPLLSTHAQQAADVGMQLEMLNMRVLAQREIDTGDALDTAKVPPAIQSVHRSADGTTTNKRPDLAIVAADGTHFIAIEIERQRSRPLVTYRDKLTAYYANPDITAIWYVCQTAVSAERVRTANTQVLDSLGWTPDVPLRLGPLTNTPGYWELETLDRRRRFLDDLEAVR